MNQSPIPFFIVDAFTDQPFCGNPAAVVPLSEWKDDDWLQRVAMEMNLSETAFFVRKENGFDLRWLTPQVEVDLCGHATLATAFVISEFGFQDDCSKIQFESRSGGLIAGVRANQVRLDFPITPETQADPPGDLLEALGVLPKYVGKSRFDYLLEIGTEAELRDMTPDWNRLARVDCRGVIVTSLSSDPAYDFVSRFFAPASGVNEDPVTGSAHCCLADYWRKRLGRTEFVAFQASHRGGRVDMQIQGERVILGGRAVIVARGELLL